MDISSRDALFATAAYADIFDYPLTGDEMAHWMIGKTFVKIELAKGVEKHGEYFYLSGRTSIIPLRKKRLLSSKHKWKVAHDIARKLMIVPTIELVGVTGALAMNNAGTDDDIDLLIITSPRAMWITRLLAILLVDRLGQRRRPGDHDVTDKVCLNMFMSADRLTIPKKEQDLFSAHETLQMKPLWQRGNTYKEYLRANGWVNRFLPQAAASVFDRTVFHHRIEDIGFVRSILVMLLTCTEGFARIIQMMYMRRRQTSEVFTPSMLRFHPKDARQWVREAYAKRLALYNIPLDNIFYDR